ncbi:hypothetical protein PSRA_0814 [Pseudoscardovia radai]|uniref:Antitoxin SocA-like Panacea domain-containing protein n=1 Tax=Pseudoscardovia radai TaxID=987066 RepID=A0A261EXZ6_9BIFI|nr:type II toxin-antitoxin system antitoxin SocA domain-containing protein [Pseudoscardovia radai]OZG51734.1 hypothetical protein PSRA_0814 [Pseudoscardovia radai]
MACDDSNTGGLSGAGVPPSYIANAILARSFRDGVPVTPMKLQKLLFFVCCMYQRNTGRRLVSERFQAWRYGPVCPSVYVEFKGFRSGRITRYAQDALGKSYVIDEGSSPALRSVLDVVWDRMKGYDAVYLSRVTHLPGSAWSKANDGGHLYVDEVDMTDDTTFDHLLTGAPHGR